MHKTLIDKILAQANTTPYAPAFIFQGKILNYRRLLAAISVIAKHFYDKGIRPGDVVGVSMSKSPLHCFTVIALARLGAVSVPLTPKLEGRILDTLIQQYNILAIVSSWAWDRPVQLKKGLITLNSLKISGEESNLDFIDYWPTSKTPLRVAMTSGTTDYSKGVLYNNEDFVQRMDRTIYMVDSSSRLLPPDFHISLSIFFSMGVLCNGGVIVIPDKYDMHSLIHAINTFGVTHLIMAPANMVNIASAFTDTGIALPSLKHLRLVGATPSPALLKSLVTCCSPNVYVPYGLTELGPISMATPEILVNHPDSAGHVLPWVTVEVVDHNGLPVPAGYTGEIRVTLDSMPEDYYNENKKSDCKFKKGWFYPGDIGHVDPDGLLFIHGRTDNLLNIGGHKISAEKIESILLEYPLLEDVAVFVNPHEEVDQVLVAAVVAPRKIEFDKLARYSLKKLQLLSPRSFIQVATLPRNSAGKLLRDQLELLIHNKNKNKDLDNDIKH